MPAEHRRGHSNLRTYVSELQITLLLMAGAVLTGLYLAGKWQERRLLRKLSEELGGQVGDALLEGAAQRPPAEPPEARPAPIPRRVEPTLERVEPRAEALQTASPARLESEPPVPAPAARPSEWIEDPMLDCVLELRCARAVDGVAFIDAAVPLTSGHWTLPTRFVVWDARAQQWVHPDRFGYYTDALVAIQLASRRQVLDAEQIGRFFALVRQIAVTLDADCDPPDPARVVPLARELDALCARFDVRIGLTLEAEDSAWTSHQVAAAAALAGLEAAGERLWVPARRGGPPPCTLSMSSAMADRVVLELDVPAAGSGSAAVHQLFGLSRDLATKLHARIVDDNGRPIDAESVAAIEAQLDQLYDEMRSVGIDPGGLRAQRLYV